MKELIRQAEKSIADYAPFGLRSESSEWYQHTFQRSEARGQRSDVILGKHEVLTPESSRHPELVYPGRDSGSLGSASSDSGRAPLSLARMTEKRPGVDNRKAMVIMAHPDDESELAGGFIATLADKGYAVTVVHLTDGRKGGDKRNPMTEEELVKTRLEESIAAGQALGVHRLINLGAIDGELPMDPASDPELLNRLVKVMRQEGGSLYITHPMMFNPHTFDYHSDHRHTANFVERAIQLARNGNHALEFGEPLDNVPTLLYVDPQNLKSGISLTRREEGKAAPVSALLDITAVHGRKVQAFSQHASQVNNLPDGVTDNYVVQRIQQDEFRARQVRSLVPYFLRRAKNRYAEGLTAHHAAGFDDRIPDDLKGELRSPRRLFPRRRL
jgi:LmbE family N-acetylglucosaminyl deacetylase